MPAERLQPFRDGFERRHGIVTVLPGQDGTVTFSAPDGAEAVLHLRYPEVRLDSDPWSAFRSAAQQPRRLALIAVRRERHALGIWDGDRLAASKTDRHYVQGRTKAGGWSQQRFARRRDNQARHAFESAADDAATLLEPEAADLYGVVLAGDGRGLNAVLGDPRCRMLAALAASRPLERLGVADPTREALIDLAGRFRSAVVDLNELA